MEDKMTLKEYIPGLFDMPFIQHLVKDTKEQVEQSYIWLEPESEFLAYAYLKNNRGNISFKEKPIFRYVINQCILIHEIAHLVQLFESGTSTEDFADEIVEQYMKFLTGE